jgi:hypothetical protein
MSFVKLRRFDESRGGLLAEGQIHRSLGHRPRWWKARPDCWLKANFNSEVNMAFGQNPILNGPIS